MPAATRVLIVDVDAEQSLGRPIDHPIFGDGRIVVYALNRGVPFTVSNREAQVSRDVRRLADHLLKVEVPVPAEPADPRKRPKAAGVALASRTGPGRT